MTSVTVDDFDDRPSRSPRDVIAAARGLLDVPYLGAAIKGAFWALALWLVATQVFDMNSAAILNGVAIGSLYGIIGVGLVVVYRTNRIINFAAAGIGAVPGVTFSLLLVIHDWSWYVAFPLTIISGALLGAIIDIGIIRRFSHAPRLILTVATLGLTQVLAFISLLIPIWMGSGGQPISFVPSPFKRFTFVLGNEIFTADFVFTIVLAVLATAGLTAFFKFTRMGIALRASAENADRAALLGIPVKLVGTVSWALAGAIGALAIFLRAATVGVPTDGSLGPKVLLFALTAAVIARMDSIPVALFAGMGVGILEGGSVASRGDDSLAAAMMLIVILGAILFQSGALSRAYDMGQATWQSVKEFRPVPTELVAVREVVVGRAVAGVLAVAFFVAFPHIISEGKIGFAQIIVIFSMVAVSLVILTGWAGQISLGQFGIVGVGALVAGWLSDHHNLDFFLITLIAALAGAGVSVLIGIPALRIKGLLLAVTTLALGATMEGYVLRSDSIFGGLLPDNSLNAPVLWDGRIATGDSVGTPTIGFYYLCLVLLAMSLMMARSYRRNRAGRAVVAERENSRAASSLSINPAATKLGAFAVSGAIAAVAGVLLAFQTTSVDRSVFGIVPSLDIFVIAAIGGLTSLSGAVAATVIIKGIEFFGQDVLGGSGFESFSSIGGFVVALAVIGLAVLATRRGDALVRRLAIAVATIVGSLVAVSYLIHETSAGPTILDNLDLVVAGPGLLLVLLFMPGGLAEAMFGARDGFLRAVAAKHDIHVPSLVADSRIEEEQHDDSILSEAEHHLEEIEETMAHAAPGEGGTGAGTEGETR